MYDHGRYTVAFGSSNSAEIRSKSLTHLIISAFADLSLKVELFTKTFSGILVETLEFDQLLSFANHENGYDTNQLVLDLGHLTLQGDDTIKVTIFNDSADTNRTCQITSIEREVKRDYFNRYGKTTMKSNSLNDVSCVIFDPSDLTTPEDLTYDITIDEKGSIISNYALNQLQNTFDDKLSNNDLASIDTKTVLYNADGSPSSFFYEVKGDEQPIVLYKQVIVDINRISETETSYKQKVQNKESNVYAAIKRRDTKASARVIDAVRGM